MKKLLTIILMLLTTGAFEDDRGRDYDNKRH